MESRQDLDKKTGKQNQSGGRRRFVRVFLVGLSIIGATAFIAYEIGLFAGAREARDVVSSLELEAAMGVPVIILMQVISVIKLSLDYGRKPVSGTIGVMVILLFLQLYFFRNFGYTNGMLAGAGNVSRVKSVSRHRVLQNRLSRLSRSHTHGRRSERSGPTQESRRRIADHAGSRSLFSLHGSRTVRGSVIAGRQVSLCLLWNGDELDSP